MKNFKLKQNPYITNLIESAIVRPTALLAWCWILIFAGEISAQTPGLWRGYNDEDWNNPTNWDNGIVPDNTVDVVVTTSSVHYPIIMKKLVVGPGYVSGDIYRCKSLEIQQWTRIDSNDSLWVNGNMTVAGLYLYTDQWLSGTHQIYAGGTLNITPAGSVFIGQYGFTEEMIQDLVVNSGGTLVNAGYLNINDCLIIRSGGTFTMTGNEAYIMGWEGNYSTALPGSFYVEAGASGGVSGGNFHVQGKEKPGYHAFTINEPSFDFTGTSLLHLFCESDQMMPYPDFSSSTVAGVECWNLTVENLGSVTTFFGTLKVNNDFDIVAPSSVTIASGAQIDVLHDMFVKTDVGLSSDYYSSLIDYGQLNVAGESQLQWALAGQQWHLVSSPVTGETADVFNGMYLQRFTETTNLWSDITSPGYVLQVMNGYAAWFDNYWNQGVYFTGTFNTGTIGTAGNLTKNNQGWNLVGNPYPSPIDWDASSGWTKTGINNAIYSEDDGNWATYINGVGTNGGSRYISPCQGLFVLASTNPATLMMNNSVRVHNKPLFMKNDDGMLVRLEASSETDKGIRTDEAVVRIDEQATDGFDGDFDAVKLFATDPEIPQIYSSPDNLSVNTLPVPTDVTVKFIAGTSGNYTIWASEMSGCTQVFLTDLFSGTITDLTKSDYEFSYLPQSEPERFLLQFHPSGVETFDDGKKIMIQATGSLLLINFDKETINESGSEMAQIIVADILGRRILHVSEKAMEQIQVDFTGNGIFIVTVRLGKILTSQKMIIY